MSRICARCHIRFRRTAVLRMRWCAQDQFYVCWRCWEQVCVRSHGPRGLSAAAHGVVLLAIAALLTAPAAPMGALFVFHNGILEEWATGPLTAIANLQRGVHARIVGTVISPAGSVFGGYEQRGEDGWYWTWNASGSFRVTDFTGVVLVDMGQWWEVEPGPHLAPNAVHSDGTVYMAGDTVYVSGTVRTAANGTPVFMAQILSPSPVIPEPSAFFPLATVALLAPLVALWVWGGVSDLGRKASHRRVVAGVKPVDVRADGAKRDPRLRWVANARWVPPRGRPLVAIGITAAIVGVFALLVFGVGVARREAQTGVAVLMGMAGIVVVLGWLLVLFGSAVPSFVAFSERGFHRWYGTPLERLVNDDFTAWDEIWTIERRKEGDEPAIWYLKELSGAEEALDYLSKRNLSGLRKAWRIHGRELS